MERKLVRQGNNALTLTLPKTWIQYNNLKPGDSVSINVKNNELSITAAPKDIEKKAEVDLDEIKGIISKYIKTLYKEGVTEIRLNYSDPGLLKEVQETLKEEIIGYEIVEQDDKRALIKSVAEITEESFDSMFRRIFIINSQMLEALHLILKGKKFREIDNALYLETVNNKLTNFCRRSISKRLYEHPSMINTYLVLERLERMADEIKFTLQFIRRKPEFSEREILLCSETLIFFKLSQKAYFSDDFHSFVGEAIKRKDLIEDTLSTLQKEKRGDFVTMHYLVNIVQYIAQILTYRLQRYFLEN
jgi:phosphate uptake regulator